MVNLSELQRSKAGSLSGGQMRRMGIAQALVHSPSILILDEPYAGLDPDQRANLRELLVDLSRLISIIVSTHQTEDLSEIYKSVVVIDKGAVRFSGSAEEFFDNDDGLAYGANRAEMAYRRIVGTLQPGTRRA